MIPFDILIELFDLSSYPISDFAKPTDQSISKINYHFGIKLPDELIELALKSKNYGSWFASIGEDYNNDFHIIRINRYFKRLRQKRHDDKWRPAKPKEYIVINQGHDDDCDCLDVCNWSKKYQDYEVVYWYPGIEEIEIRYSCFRDYFEGHVMSWVNHHFENKNRSGSLRSDSREIVPKIKAILNKT